MNLEDRSISRRELLVGGALVTAALAGGILAHTREVSAERSWALDEIVPARIGQWSQAPLGGLSIPQDETPRDKVYDDLLTRLYTAPGTSPIMLLIAYGAVQSGNTRLHRPEDCYPANGFHLQRRADLVVPMRSDGQLTARSFTATAPARTEQLIYWTRIGREFPQNTTEQRWSTVRQMAAGRIADGALLRISTINPAWDSAAPLLSEFASALLRVGNPQLERLLKGEA